MKKESEYPIPVQNLRRIWDQYKREHKITQVEVGKKLGMSQSGFSHYISNITALNPSAIMKIATFLEVHPAEIDPSWGRDIPVEYTSVTVNSRRKKRISSPAHYTHKHLYEYDAEMQYPLPKGCLFVAIPTTQLSHKHSGLWLVRENKDSNWVIIEQAEQPTRKDGWGAVKAIAHIFT